jgi:hypothetical protein
MQNVPPASEMYQDSGRPSHKIKSFALKAAFWGPRLAVVTSPPYTKTLSKIEKLTFVGRRFKSPFFLWPIQILKAVMMIMAMAIAFFLLREAYEIYESS